MDPIKRRRGNEADGDARPTFSQGQAGGCRTAARAACRGLSFAAAAMLVFSCTPKETTTLLQPAEALGKVLAEEAIHLAGAKKSVAVITPDASWGPVSTAEEAFRNTLKKRGVVVLTAKAARLGDPMRRGPLGLKGEDFLEALEKSADAGAVVSFAGAPLLSGADAARVPAQHPPVVVVATASLGNVAGSWADPARVSELLEHKIIRAAVVDAAPDSAAGPSGNADATHQMFSQHFRVLHAPE